MLVSAVLLISSLAAGTASGDDLPAFERIRIVSPATRPQEVPLLDTAGESFSLARLRGNVSLIFFGFTNCPDVCPMTVRRLQEFRASGAVDTARVNFVLISVDGERDSPEAMRMFLDTHAPGFVGVTGDPRAVKKLVTEFRAPFFRGNEAGAQQGNTAAHAPQVFVVDADGALRGEFYNASFDAMAGIIEALLAEHRVAQAPR